MAQGNTDEIDLGIVFSKIKELGNNFLIGIYNAIQFVFKHWWKLLILLIIGGTIGYFLEKKNDPNKETTLIVQNNFNSSNYVYEAIDQLNKKIKEGDTVYLKNAGFRTDTIVLREVLIEPVVNINELLNMSRDTYRPLETFLENASFEDEILMSEMFYSEYLIHKIYIKTSSYGTQNDINLVIDFLNNNEVFNKIKKVVVKETEDRVIGYKETVKKVDAILESQSNLDNNSSQLVVSNGADFTDFYQLINQKNNSVNQIIKLETELVKYGNIVTVINNPSLTKVKKLLSNQKINFALLFVFLYLFFFMIKNMYTSIKKLSENIDNNK